MGCRCKDIRKCLKDISTIGEIEGLVNNLEGTNVSVSMELQSLAINCMSTFYCANMGELMSEEKRLNEDMTELLPELANKCETKITKLQSQYRSMKREDHSYHHRHHHNK
jgi:hypothetical protein